MDYSLQLQALLGACVDTQLVEPRIVYQYECRIDVVDPAKTLADAARDILVAMRRLGCTRVNPVTRPTSRWLDVNCLMA